VCLVFRRNAFFCLLSFRIRLNSVFSYNNCTSFGTHFVLSLSYLWMSLFSYLFSGTSYVNAGISCAVEMSLYVGAVRTLLSCAVYTEWARKITGPFWRVCNSCIIMITQKCDLYIEIFNKLSGVRIVPWILLRLNILCTRLAKQCDAKNKDLPWFTVLPGTKLTATYLVFNLYRISSKHGVIHRPISKRSVLYQKLYCRFEFYRREIFFAEM